ncbi:hypothetical protein C5F51_09365 [Nocardia nova]|uniref:Uncharacterized protein n=1 Tax=Nocardia nova TaxID=37330 RepID=A0A2S6AAW2_9NOCA|nr:hypothetical protein [Nocardia nova]PPJ30647.1 hypothetical protein C5F51_09365 [Nocardia nova]
MSFVWKLFDEVIVDVPICLFGGFDDRHPQLTFGPRGDGVIVLDRGVHVIGASGQENRAHHQHSEVDRIAASGGGNVQGSDERLSLRLVRTLCEDLLDVCHRIVSDGDYQTGPRMSLRHVGIAVPDLNTL